MRGVVAKRSGSTCAGTSADACTAIFYPATLFALSEFLAHSIGRRSASIRNPGRGTTGFSGRRLMLLRNGSLLEDTGIRTPGPPHEKNLHFFADRAAKKWPLRGSLKLGVERLWPALHDGRAEHSLSGFAGR